MNHSQLHDLLNPSDLLDLLRKMVHQGEAASIGNGMNELQRRYEAALKAGSLSSPEPTRTTANEFHDRYDQHLEGQ